MEKENISTNLARFSLKVSALITSTKDTLNYNMNFMELSLIDAHCEIVTWASISLQRLHTAIILFYL